MGFNKISKDYAEIPEDFRGLHKIIGILKEF